MKPNETALRPNSRKKFFCRVALFLLLVGAQLAAAQYAERLTPKDKQISIPGTKPSDDMYLIDFWQTSQNVPKNVTKRLENLFGWYVTCPNDFAPGIGCAYTLGFLLNSESAQCSTGIVLCGNSSMIRDIQRDAVNKMKVIQVAPWYQEKCAAWDNGQRFTVNDTHWMIEHSHIVQDKSPTGAKTINPNVTFATKTQARKPKNPLKINGSVFFPYDKNFQCLAPGGGDVRRQFAFFGGGPNCAVSLEISNALPAAAKQCEMDYVKIAECLNGGNAVNTSRCEMTVETGRGTEVEEEVLRRKDTGSSASDKQSSSNKEEDKKREPATAKACAELKAKAEAEFDVTAASDPASVEISAKACGKVETERIRTEVKTTHAKKIASTSIMLSDSARLEVATKNFRHETHKIVWDVAPGYNKQMGQIVMECEGMDPFETGIVRVLVYQEGKRDKANESVGSVSELAKKGDFSAVPIVASTTATSASTRNAGRNNKHIVVFTSAIVSIMARALSVSTFAVWSTKDTLRWR